MRYHILLALLAVAAAVGTAPAQPAPDFDALDAVVREEMAAGSIPGAAVAVVYQGRLVYAKGFGVVSVEDPRPVTPDMLFRIGSTTKMLTAAAFIRAADAAGARLDAPVGTYADGLDPAVGRVTAHQLLSHTAGLADKGAPFGPDDEDALAEEVRSWRADAFFTEPGAIHSYASRGYWLAGYLLERLTGRPYADAMDSLLFTPLGMTRSTLRPLVAMTYPLAVGHLAADGSTVVARPAANNAATWPGGSVFSNVYDLARFATAFMVPADTAGLPAFVPERLGRPHADVPGAPGAHYGYGLSMGTYDGVRFVYHGGVSRGYGALVQMAPAYGFAVVALTNRHAALLWQTAQQAAALALPLVPDTPADAAAPEAPAVADVTAEEIARVAGTYAQGDLAWRLFGRDGRLVLTFGGTAYPLVRTGPDRYASEDGALSFVLVSDAAGAPYLFDGLYAARKAGP